MSNDFFRTKIGKKGLKQEKWTSPSNEQILGWKNCTWKIDETCPF